MNAPWAVRSVAEVSLTLAAAIIGGAIPSAGAGGSAEGVLEREPPEVVERLMDQRLLVFEEAGKSRDSFVIAYVVFESSLQNVIGLLRQASRQTEYRTELDSVETVRTFESGRIDEQRIRIMFTDLIYRLRYRDVVEAEGRLEWTLDPDFDNDMSQFEGFWEFHPFAQEPNRTLARFGSNVDVGPAVPRFIQKSMSRKTVLSYLENCRRWIDSGGEWRP